MLHNLLFLPLRVPSVATLIGSEVFTTYPALALPIITESAVTCISLNHKSNILPTPPMVRSGINKVPACSVGQIGKLPPYCSIASHKLLFLQDKTNESFRLLAVKSSYANGSGVDAAGLYVTTCGVLASALMQFQFPKGSALNMSFPPERLASYLRQLMFLATPTRSPSSLMM